MRPLLQHVYWLLLLAIVSAIGHRTLASSIGTATKSAQTFLAIHNLGATAGNACAVLSWTELPEGSVKGYNVYRVSNGKPVKLTATPQAFPMYADTGLTNGTAYHYQVSSVDTHGHESARSSQVSAIPSASVASLTWVSPPSSASGNARIYASPSGGTVTGLMVLVDGAEYGSAGLSDPNLHPAGSIEAVFDTSGLTNGTHTVQIIGYSATGMAATRPLTVLCGNTVSNFNADDLIDLDNNEVSHVNAVLPTDTTSWTIRITDDRDRIVFTKRGATQKVHFAWNAKSADGKKLPEGIYTLMLTAITSSTSKKYTTTITLYKSKS